MIYTKTSKPYAELRATIERRGMTINDRKAAETQLRRIGYFRLGAYTYPFRELLPAGAPRETSFQHRSENFVPGSNFDQVMSLYHFDIGLRKVCLEGLQELEVSVRAAIAHVLSRRSPFAHLDRAHLDAHACSSIDGAAKKENFQLWMETYTKARKDSKDEDFVGHHLVKYGNDLPIWMTTEILTFGGLVRLFSLMQDGDKTAVAKYFGVKDGRRVHKWLLALNGLRNVCAHHHRLWNRQLTYEVKVPGAVVGEQLQHVASMGNSKKIYHVLALLAYMLRNRDSGSQWHLSFKTQIRKFPNIILTSPHGSGALISAQYSMGLPAQWETLPLWNAK